MCLNVNYTLHESKQTCLLTLLTIWSPAVQDERVPRKNPGHKLLSVRSRNSNNNSNKLSIPKSESEVGRLLSVGVTGHHDRRQKAEEFTRNPSSFSLFSHNPSSSVTIPGKQWYLLTWWPNCSLLFQDSKDQMQMWIERHPRVRLFTILLSNQAVKWMLRPLTFCFPSLPILPLHMTFGDMILVTIGIGDCFIEWCFLMTCSHWILRLQIRQTTTMKTIGKELDSHSTIHT